MQDQDITTAAQTRLDDWEKKAISWYVTYYVLGGLAVVFTITVASRPHFIDPSVIADFAWLAALCQGLSTFLLASRKAASYRTAWRTVWLAKVEYLRSEKDSNNASALEQAINNGWATIDGGYVDEAARKHPRTPGR
jgi:hypothetical protein